MVGFAIVGAVYAVSSATFMKSFEDIGARDAQQMAQLVWGADGYLTKPVDLKVLQETLERLVPAKR